MKIKDIIVRPILDNNPIALQTGYVYCIDSCGGIFQPVCFNAS